MTPALGRRLTALVYEGVLLFGLMMVVGAAYSLATNQRHSLIGRHGMMAAQFLALSVYFLWFWTHGGQTLASKTWHLRLVSATGRPLQLQQALARFMLGWLWLMPPLIGAWLAGWHRGEELLAAVVTWLSLYILLSHLLPQGQFLHDVVCGTLVIDSRIPPSVSPPSTPEPR